MILELKHLMLEVTRQCNMSCAHCMRGEAENLSISKDVLERLFADTRHIEHLGITGGEPSLVPETLNWLNYYIVTNGCTIGHFFFATNAAAYSPEFIDELNVLYSFCIDKESCVFTVSKDQYHGDTSSEALKKYRALPYYKPVKERMELPSCAIISEGRAKQNGLGGKELPVSDYVYDYSLKGLDFKCNDTVYINALGDVLLDADLSYERQKKYRLGNLLRDDLADILYDNIYHQTMPPNKWVFQLHLCAEPGTIAYEELEENRYYKHELKAMADYSNILHNLHITPVNPSFRDVPGNLQLTSSELPVNRNEILPASETHSKRLAGTEIKYAIEDGQILGTVTVEVRCLLLEDTDDE